MNNASFSNFARELIDLVIDPKLDEQQRVGLAHAAIVSFAQLHVKIEDEIARGSEIFDDLQREISRCEDKILEKEQEIQIIYGSKDTLAFIQIPTEFQTFLYRNGWCSQNEMNMTVQDFFDLFERRIGA